MITDTEKIAMIREAMPATQNSVYLNTGSVGPISTITSEAIRQHDTLELLEGRASTTNYYAFMQTKTDLRQAFADLVKAKAEEIALTQHTTGGMNIVAHGLPWQPGDEVITTNLEHPGGLLPFYVLRQRYGVVVKVMEIPLAGDDVVARLEAAITPRTRLLAFSHVAWNTGLCLPLDDIVTMAHRHHVLTVVDAAQAIGAIPLDLPASRVDFYAMSGQKWLCGPEGTGALYVRRDRMNELAPTFVGYAAMDRFAGHDWTGYYMPQPDARRYEGGTVYRPAISGMLANLTWLRDRVGWPWIHRRIAEVADYARRALRETSGVTVLSPAGARAGLVTFAVEGYDPARLVVKLSQEKITLRYIPDPYALRISTGFFNTEADIDRLVAALQAIQKLDPESLPEPDW